MQTRRVRTATPEPEVVAEAAATLLAGGLVIYPTDTLYALGCRAADGAAARRVRDAKGRDDGKPLPLIAADTAQVEDLALLSHVARRIASALWPGPVTLVLPARPGVPAEVTSGGTTVAVRVPALELARRLCAAAGPLVSTSANRSGNPAPATCEEAVREVGESAALALDGGPGGGPPSTNVDVTDVEPRLVRLGATPWSEIAAALR